MLSASCAGLLSRLLAAGSVAEEGRREGEEEEMREEAGTREDRSLLSLEKRSLSRGEWRRGAHGRAGRVAPGTHTQLNIGMHTNDGQ